MRRLLCAVAGHRWLYMQREYWTCGQLVFTLWRGCSRCGERSGRPCMEAAVLTAWQQPATRWQHAR